MSAREASSLTEQERERGTVTPIAPYVVEVDPASFSNDISIRFSGALRGEPTRMEFDFPMYSNVARALGSLFLRYERGGRDQRPIDVLENRFEVSRDLAVVGNCAARSVRFASGSRETPGRHLVYWEVGNIDPASVSLVDFLESWRALVKEPTQ